LHQRNAIDAKERFRDYGNPMILEKDDAKFPSPRWLLAILAGILLILAIGGAWIYLRQQSHLQRRTEQFLSAIAQLKVNEIVQWRSEMPADSAALSESPVFPGMVQEWMNLHLPAIQSWPTESWSAESLLVRRDDDSVLILSEPRYSIGRACKKRIPLTRDNDPAAMAVLGRKGIVEGIDYRGEKVFAAVQPIPQTPWFLVAKMDKSEAMEEGHFSGLLIIGLTLSLFIAASAITWAAWQQGRKSNYKLRLGIEEAKRESEERYRITLMSIGDGVIITDGSGNVTLLNAVAENLTGWKQDEAYGKPIDEIFNIYHEQTHQKVEDPISEVIRTGQVIGPANHTLLLSRNGVEYPIKDSSAPIRNNKGDLIGVVLVFRDQTVERTAERLLQAEHNRLQESVDLLMTDVVMPGMNGRQLADHLIGLHPEMQILYTSGYTDEVISHHRVLEEDLNFIAKPYSLFDLSITIRKLLDRSMHPL
jgi:PAS domain S-box-containing protein